MGSGWRKLRTKDRTTLDGKKESVVAKISLRSISDQPAYWSDDIWQFAGSCGDRKQQIKIEYNRINWNEKNWRWRSGLVFFID